MNNYFKTLEFTIGDNKLKNSSSRISKKLSETHEPHLSIDYITGERFQELADLSLMTRDKIEFHKSLNPSVEKIIIDYQNITEKDIETISKYKKLFVYMDHLDLFFEKVYPRLTSQFVLLCHNGDLKFKKEFQKYLDESKLLHCISVNCEFRHHKLTNIPIGLANRMWEHGNLEVFDKVRRASINSNFHKTALYYFYFTISTNFMLRIKLYEKLKFFFEWGRKENFENYLMRLATSKFAICPEGNGYDTHRLSESVYFNTIPILDQDSEFTKNYYQNFGVDMNKLNPFHLKTLDKNIESLKNIYNLTTYKKILNEL